MRYSAYDFYYNNKWANSEFDLWFPSDSEAIAHAGDVLERTHGKSNLIGEDLSVTRCTIYRDDRDERPCIATVVYPDIIVYKED